MSTTDAVIRIIIAIIFAALYFTGTVTGTIGIILLILGGIFILTSIFRICPLYLPLGISTVKKK